MINLNLHTFVTAYHTKEDKNPIVNKFSCLLLWGFLFIATFTSYSSGLSTELSGRCDKPTQLNFNYLVSKPQRATATPWTTRTLKHPIAFVDDYSKRGLRVERRIEVESQRNIRVLKFGTESIHQNSHFEESPKTKMLIKQALNRDA